MWCAASENPRIIEVQYRQRERRFITDAKVPAVLQVCHESRWEVKKTYKIFKIENNQNTATREMATPGYRSEFERNSEPQRLTGQGISNDMDQVPAPKELRTYINYESDIIYLPARNCSYPHDFPGSLRLFFNLLKQQADLTKIQKIAFDHEYFNDIRSHDLLQALHSDHFGNIVSIHVVLHDARNGNLRYPNGKLARSGMINGFKVIEPKELVYTHRLMQFPLTGGKVIELAKSMMVWNASIYGDHGSNGLRQRIESIAFVPVVVLREMHAVVGVSDGYE